MRSLAVSPPAHRCLLPDGLKLAVEVGGASSVPLVLLHGYCGTRHELLSIRDALVKTRRVVSVEHRGHGESDRGGPYTVEQLVLDLTAVVDALDAPKVDLLGHSMGGMVAARFAARSPDRVRTLTLMSTTGGPFFLDEPTIPCPSSSWSRLRRRIAIARGQDGASALAARLEGPKKLKAELRSVLRLGHERVDPAASDNLYRDFRRLEPVDPDLGAFTGPALVVVGQNDQPMVAPSRTLAVHLPRGRLAILPGVGHFPMFEARAELLELLDSHLPSSWGTIYRPTFVRPSPVISAP